jgi:hypothetical protein
MGKPTEAYPIPREKAPTLLRVHTMKRGRLLFLAQVYGEGDEWKERRHHAFDESAPRRARKGWGLTTLLTETGRGILPRSFEQTHLCRRREYLIFFSQNFI